MLVPLPEEAISVFASIVVSIEVLLVGTPIKSQPVDVPASPVPFIHLWYLLLLPPESLIVPATIILENIKETETELLDKQTEDDMLWIRKNWLDNPKLASKLILHGHTIVEQVTHYGNRINIDTGAAWGDNLSAVVTINDNVWLLTNQGRTEITPHNKQ